MEIFSLKVYVKLKINVTFFQIPAFLGKNIYRSMLLDEELKDIHAQGYFKPYCVDFLRSMEGKKDEFLVGDTAFFTIRSTRIDFLQKFRFCIESSKNLEFQVLSTMQDVIIPKHINTLYTMTPASFVKRLSENNKATPWTRENGSIEDVKDMMILNLKRKYENFLEKEVNVDTTGIISAIEIKTNKAFLFKYKRANIYAYRYLVCFADEPLAQNLAMMAMALGIGLKNTLGFGFTQRGKNDL